MKPKIIKYLGAWAVIWLGRKYWPFDWEQAVGFVQGCKLPVCKDG